jgi:hypothetical protein
MAEEHQHDVVSGDKILDRLNLIRVGRQENGPVACLLGEILLQPLPHMPSINLRKTLLFVRVHDEMPAAPIEAVPGRPKELLVAACPGDIRSAAFFNPSFDAGFLSTSVAHRQTRCWHPQVRDRTYPATFVRDASARGRL